MNDVHSYQDEQGDTSQTEQRDRPPRAATTSSYRSVESHQGGESVEVHNSEYRTDERAAVAFLPVNSGQSSRPVAARPLQTAGDNSYGGAARFMHAIFGIRRIAETIGRCSVSAPLRAALLAILVTHLAFMPSSLHGSTLTERSHTAALASTGVGQANASDERAAHDEHSGHCIIQWTKAAQWMALASCLAIISASTGNGLEQHLIGMRPPARAHEPPHGDLQALLLILAPTATMPGHAQMGLMMGPSLD